MVELLIGKMIIISVFMMIRSYYKKHYSERVKNWYNAEITKIYEERKREGIS